MDKQKQIEEMARTTCNYNAKNFESCVECIKGGLLSCDRLVQAEKLYNAGYRKIPENAVVVSKQIWDEHIENREEGMKIFEKRVRKETAEKFAERVKMAFYYEFDELIPSIMADKIDEICKEITEGKNGN